MLFRKVHDISAGRLAHARFTPKLNPLSALTVTVSPALLPTPTLAGFGDTLNANVPGSAAVMISLVDATPVTKSRVATLPTVTWSVPRGNVDVVNVAVLVSPDPGTSGAVPSGVIVGMVAVVYVKFAVPVGAA